MVVVIVYVRICLTHVAFPKSPVDMGNLALTSRSLRHDFLTVTKHSTGTKHGHGEIGDFIITTRVSQVEINLQSLFTKDIDQTDTYFCVANSNFTESNRMLNPPTTHTQTLS